MIHCPHCQSDLEIEPPLPDERERFLREGRSFAIRRSMVRVGTVFEGLAKIADGASNTAVLAEAAEPVPWTKPADLPLEAGKPLPGLGGVHPDGCHVLLADGSVCFLRRGWDEAVLRSLFLRGDGLVVDWHKLK